MEASSRILFTRIQTKSFDGIVKIEKNQSFYQHNKNMLEFDNYIDSFVSRFDSHSFRKILTSLESLRFVKCSTSHKSKFNNQDCHDMIDLLDIDQFCRYMGDQICDREIENVEKWIHEGIVIIRELNNILLFFYSSKNAQLLNDTVQITNFQEKLEYAHLILKNLNDIACRKREHMDKRRDTKISIKICDIPPYLINLLELYADQNKFMSITISELSIFLADIVQFDFPLLEKEKTSLKILLEASINKKYPLMTRKHLSYRFFYFFSSIRSFNIFASQIHLLEETFQKKVHIHSTKAQI
tara:strand:- start:17 stop:913 length:897 start_codon:yes stop_codon:yes gene_type:complete